MRALGPPWEGLKMVSMMMDLGPRGVSETSNAFAAEAGRAADVAGAAMMSLIVVVVLRRRARLPWRQCQ